MPLLSSRRLLAPAAAGLGLSLLSALPAGAHSVADGGLLAGASHPLLGLDHLLLLLGVGAVATLAGAQMLLFALAGALAGGVMGALGGQLPGAEVLAALAVTVLGVVLLQSQRGSQPPQPGLLGAIVTAAVAVHALLHGQEASGAVSWWLGAGLASSAVVGITYALLRQLDERWTGRLAAGLSLAGLALALAPLA
jgi:urease accessory protein